MQANGIKKIKVKVKEKPWQFLIIMCSFLILSVLICGSILLQNIRMHDLSKEQKSALEKETGTLWDHMESEISQLTERLSEKESILTESEEILRELSETYGSTMEKYLPGELQKLMEHMEILREEVSASQITIQTIEKEMVERTAETDGTLGAAVNELTEAVKRIDKDMDGSLEAVQSMMESLKSQNTKEAEALAEKLADVERKVSESSESGISETRALLENFVRDNTVANNDFGQQLKQGFSDQNSKMADHQEAVMNGMNDVKDALGNGLGILQEDQETVKGTLGVLQEDQETVKDTLGTLQADNEAIKAILEILQRDDQSINGQLGAIKEELQTVAENLSSVFQSVSNVKKTLVSALLTKGSTVPEDATFEEIKEAILNIDQTLLLEEGSVQGKISYEYHYHTDGNGNVVDAPLLPEPEGCFTKPAYHIHSGDRITGGGCYSVPVRHQHFGTFASRTGCYQRMENVIKRCDTQIRAALPDGNGSVRCPNCNTVMECDPDSYDSGDDTYLFTCSKVLSMETKPGCGKEQGEVEYYVLGCEKEPGITLEGYEPKCGMVHGQITKASIIFDRQ